MEGTGSSLFLGIDLSTQGCKAVVLDEESFEILAESRVNFEEDLPHYNTTSGFVRLPEGRVVSPTLMWVEGLELVLKRLSQGGGLPREKFKYIKGVSASGQMHGSVYWSRKAPECLSRLQRGPSPPPSSSPAPQQKKDALVDLMEDAFSFPMSPIWMDTSTTETCRSLENFMGGSDAVSRVTGSRAYERFTVHHIVEARKRDTTKFDSDVFRVSLVSSFVVSLLCGQISPIDWSDASGMNLMDLQTKMWSPEIVKWSGVKHLEELLGDPIAPWTVVGSVAPFFCDKFGFSSECRVVAGTGDNASAIVGMGLCRTGDLAVTLGTSDCLLAVLDRPLFLPMGHVMVHPFEQGKFYAMLTYTNGDVTRRAVRDEFLKSSGPSSFSSGAGGWASFDAAVRGKAPGCSREAKGEEGKGTKASIGFFFTVPEITPSLDLPKGKMVKVYGQHSGDEKKGGETKATGGDVTELRIVCFDIETTSGERVSSPAPPLAVESVVPPENAGDLCRLVVEQRALAMRSQITQVAPELVCPPPSSSSSSAAPAGSGEAAAAREPPPKKLCLRGGPGGVEAEGGEEGEGKEQPGMEKGTEDGGKVGGQGESRLLVTGGGAKSGAIRQVLADVFQRPVAQVEVAEAAALGAAMRALQGSLLFVQSGDAQGAQEGASKVLRLRGRLEGLSSVSERPVGRMKKDEGEAHLDVERQYANLAAAYTNAESKMLSLFGRLE